MSEVRKNFLCGCHSGLDSIHKPNLNKSKIRLLTGLIELAGLLLIFALSDYET
jgi:hypothetical protein